MINDEIRALLNVSTLTYRQWRTHYAKVTLLNIYFCSEGKHVVGIQQKLRDENANYPVVHDAVEHTDSASDDECIPRRVIHVY